MARSINAFAPWDLMEHKPVVLVIDDSADNRQILSLLIRSVGHEPLLAADGAEGLAVIRATHPDLVLVDLGMPVLDGFGVLEAVRADAELREIPCLVISGASDVQNIVRALRLGAADFLPKPFNAEILRARIDASLERKRLLDERAATLARVVQEQKRSDELLHALFPEDVVTELKLEETVRPRKRSDVVILFADVVGFTAYSSGRDPQEVVDHLGRLIESFELIAGQFGLEQIKTIGDCYMASAGLLSPRLNGVVDCINAALKMIEVTPGVVPEWALRVGIHIGEVSAGVIGRQRYLFDVWGDTVNTAARIQDAGAAGTVNLSAEARTRAGSKFQYRTLGLVDVKGKGSIEMFAVKSP